MRNSKSLTRHSLTSIRKASRIKRLQRKKSLNDNQVVFTLPPRRSIIAHAVSFFTNTLCCLLSILAISIVTIWAYESRVQRVNVIGVITLPKNACGVPV